MKRRRRRRRHDLLWPSFALLCRSQNRFPLSLLFIPAIADAVLARSLVSLSFFFSRLRALLTHQELHLFSHVLFNLIAFLTKSHTLNCAKSREPSQQSRCRYISLTLPLFCCSVFSLSLLIFPLERRRKQKERKHE